MSYIKQDDPPVTPALAGYIALRSIKVDKLAGLSHPSCQTRVLLGQYEELRQNVAAEVIRLMTLGHLNTAIQTCAGAISRLVEQAEEAGDEELLQIKAQVEELYRLQGEAQAQYLLLREAG